MFSCKLPKQLICFPHASCHTVCGGGWVRYWLDGCFKKMQNESAIFCIGVYALVFDIGVIFYFLSVLSLLFVRHRTKRFPCTHTHTHTRVPVTSHSLGWKANRAWPEEEVGLKPRDTHLPCCTWRSRATCESSSCTDHYFFLPFLILLWQNFAIYLQLFVWFVWDNRMEPFNAQLVTWSAVKLMAFILFF